MTCQIPKSPNINWYLAIQFNSHVNYLKFTSDTKALGAQFHKVAPHFKGQLQFHVEGITLGGFGSIFFHEASLFRGLFLSTDVQVTVGLSARPPMDSWLASFHRLGPLWAEQLPGLFQAWCSRSGVCATTQGIPGPWIIWGTTVCTISYPGVWPPGDPLHGKELRSVLVTSELLKSLQIWMSG